MGVSFDKLRTNELRQAQDERIAASSGRTPFDRLRTNEVLPTYPVGAALGRLPSTGGSFDWASFGASFDKLRMNELELSGRTR